MATPLNINNKVQNNGQTAEGRLSAYEFNALVDAVNGNITALDGLSLRVVNNQSEYDALAVKEPGVVYLVLDEE